MKLSFVIPIYRTKKLLTKMLERFSEQTNNNYELIFVVDTNLDNTLEVIDSFKSKIKGKIKVIYNTKRTGRNKAVKVGIVEAKGDYVSIFSVSDIILEKGVAELLTLATKWGSEIIEFNPSIKKPVRFSGKPRMQIKEKNEIKNIENIFAYTYPFEYNKIFKTDFIKNVVKLVGPNFSSINSRFSIKLIMYLILNATSYVSVSKNIIYASRSFKETFNPLQINREWKTLINDEFFAFYREALMYNCYFTNKVFYQPFSKLKKNKKLDNKLAINISKMFDSEFHKSNTYLNITGKEANLIKSSKDKIIPKFYKEF